MSDKNMELWNSVCVTDPAVTKRVNQRGGFTAIDGYSQRKRATEIFGPYGYGWGLKDLVFERYDDEMSLTCTFWYTINDIVEFPISVDMPWKSNNDTRKKLMSEAVSKSLSYLGFNADVFTGRFDDDKYIEKPGPAQQRVEQNVKKTYTQILNELIGKALAAKSVDMLEQAEQWWHKKFSDAKIDADVYEGGMRLLTDKKAELVEDAFNGEQVGLNLQA